MTQGVMSDVRLWLLCLAAAGAWGMVSRSMAGSEHKPTPGGRLSPTIEVIGPGTRDARVMVRSSGGGDLYLSLEADGPLQCIHTDRVEIPVEAGGLRADAILAIPTSLQWRRPLPGLPSAMIVRAAEADAAGRLGPVRVHTVTIADHAPLPVLSLVMPSGALFDADTGIYVVGNAMLHAITAEGVDYATDNKWWKYPGNFHGRGRDWERRTELQWSDTDESMSIHADVRVRIHGQLTRAFPQHALRVLFDQPLQMGVFPGGDGVGGQAWIVRAAGNDQVKAFMRDALLQRLCQGGLSEISASRSCVVYINGAYWGVHHLRQRMDENELARRHGLRPEEVGILEVRDGSLQGADKDMMHFKRLVRKAKAWDGVQPAFLDSLDKAIHVDAFLEYMAMMVYLDNRDWPGDNIRFWRRTGKGVTDKRWYPIIQDLDLAFGANVGPSSDPMPHLLSTPSPVAELYVALMRSPQIQERWAMVLDELLAERFAPERVLAHVDSMESLLIGEMDRHIARWRKPASLDRWRGEVDVLRDHARQRPGFLQQMVSGVQHP